MFEQAIGLQSFFVFGFGQQVFCLSLLDHQLIARVGIIHLIPVFLGRIQRTLRFRQGLLGGSSVRGGGLFQLVQGVLGVFHRLLRLRLGSFRVLQIVQSLL